MNYIYVAGPYTSPDPAVNVRRAIDVADQLANAGYAPYVPHLSHFWHFIHPHDYEHWMTLAFSWIAKCDALVRLPGESLGSDREVAEARRLGIPAFILDHADDAVAELAHYEAAVASRGVLGAGLHNDRLCIAAPCDQCARFRAAP